MSPELSDDHVAAMCRVLIDHDVSFVVIGRMAARLHNTGLATIDIDICPSVDDEPSFTSLAWLARLGTAAWHGRRNAQGSPSSSSLGAGEANVSVNFSLQLDNCSLPFRVLGS